MVQPEEPTGASELPQPELADNKGRRQRGGYTHFVCVVMLLGALLLAVAGIFSAGKGRSLVSLGLIVFGMGLLCLAASEIVDLLGCMARYPRNPGNVREAGR